MFGDVGRALDVAQFIDWEGAVHGLKRHCQFQTTLRIAARLGSERQLTDEAA